MKQKMLESILNRYGRKQEKKKMQQEKRSLSLEEENYYFREDWDTTSENPQENQDEKIEYEILEREITPKVIRCPDCGGLTLEGLENCDKCGGELINTEF